VIALRSIKHEDNNMQRRYITVDVFTDRAFGGNPLAVVLDARGLTTAQMQAIATEFNYSETTFVLATLAKQPKPQLRFEEKAGLVPVDIVRDGGKVVATELTAPQALSRMSQLSAGDVASLVSLTPEEVRTDRQAPQVVGVGTPFLVFEVTSRDAVRRAKPNAAAFGSLLPRDGAFGSYFYTRDVPAAEKPCDLQARMFFPGSSGLIEDPATGSATVAAAALLAELDSLRDGELKLTIGQGFDMGRPSLLLTRVRKQNGANVSAHVGGACVQMMEGTFKLEGEG